MRSTTSGCCGSVAGPCRSSRAARRGPRRDGHAYRDERLARRAGEADAAGAGGWAPALTPRQASRRLPGCACAQGSLSVAAPMRRRITLRAWAVLETLSGSVANRRPAVVAEMMRRDRSEVAPAGRNLVQQEIDRLDPARVEVLVASSWSVRLALGSCEGDAEEGMAAQP